MALTLGQLVSGAGSVSTGMRQAEAQQQNLRQNQLALEEQNRMEAIRQMEAARAQQGGGLQIGAPFWAQVQPGQPVGGGIPQQAPMPTAGRVGTAPAPATGPGTQYPVAGLNLTASQLAQQPLPQGVSDGYPTGAAAAPGAQTYPTDVMNQLTAARQRLDQLKGPWYLPTPEKNRAGIAQTEEEVARLEKIYREQAVPAARAEYQQVNPRYNAQLPEPTPTPGIQERINAAPNLMPNIPRIGAAAPAGGAPRAAPAPSGTPQAGAPTGNLATAVEFVESGGDPNAVNPRSGAIGPMQTMPATLVAPGYGVAPARNDSPEERRRVGVELLSAFTNRYGNEYYALVAYNWGPGNANKWIAAGADPSKLPDETRDYIPKVEARLGRTVSRPVQISQGNPGQTADQVAQAVAPRPAATAGMMYGQAEVAPGAGNPNVQTALLLRQRLAARAQDFDKYGMSKQADEALAQVAAIDLGLFKAQGDQGVYELTVTGDASRAMAVMSQFTGTPHQALDRGDGTYDLYVNGRVSKTAIPVDKLADLVRTKVDDGYRQQKAELAGFATKEGIKGEEARKTETLKSIGEIQKMMVGKQYDMEIERAKERGDLKVDSNNNAVWYREGGRTYVVTKDGYREVAGSQVPIFTKREIR